MSRLTVATRIAEVTGRNISEALRFVKTVGIKKARAAARAAQDGVSWKLPALAGAGGGTALAWREQDVRKAEAIAEAAGSNADQSATAAEALAEILKNGDDLPPDLVAELVEQLGGEAAGGDGGGDEDETDEGGASGLTKLVNEVLGGDGSGGLGALMGGAQQTVILLVVVVLVLNFALSRGASIGSNPVRAGGAR